RSGAAAAKEREAEDRGSEEGGVGARFGNGGAASEGEDAGGGEGGVVPGKTFSEGGASDGREPASEGGPIEQVERGAAGRVEVIGKKNLQRAAGGKCAGDVQRIVVEAAREAAEFEDERAGRALGEVGDRKQREAVARKKRAVVGERPR